MRQHSVQVGHSAKTYAVAGGMRQFMQNGGGDVFIRRMCVSLTYPILNRERIISANRDRLFEEVMGVGVSFKHRSLFPMEH